ncbi:hypothetical protein PAPYR_5088 [Paratrimastix pyriformis]|uniref:Protein kinase domain-containing protein n=1 Tax=Paratrimastix pyriformis TaxID=342808 RepID=A0ABQ8UKT2_9EUKA|nr:hypothetical protein PAPYR_5088 [Paratrimastix pyriformis]
MLEGAKIHLQERSLAAINICRETGCAHVRPPCSASQKCTAFPAFRPFYVDSGFGILRPFLLSRRVRLYCEFDLCRLSLRNYFAQNAATCGLSVGPGAGLWAGLGDMPTDASDVWAHPSFRVSPASLSDAQLLFEGFPIIHGEVQSSSLEASITQCVAYASMSAFAVSLLCRGEPSPPLELPLFFMPRREGMLFYLLIFRLAVQRSPPPNPTAELAFSFVEVLGPFSFSNAAPEGLGLKPEGQAWDRVSLAVRRMVPLFRAPGDVRREIVPSWLVAPFLGDARRVPDFEGIHRFRNLYFSAHPAGPSQAAGEGHVGSDGIYFKVVAREVHLLMSAVPSYLETHEVACTIGLFDKAHFYLLRMKDCGHALPRLPAPSPWDRIALGLVECVCELLKFDRAHGDLRPANATFNQERNIVQLIDFERATVADDVYTFDYVPDDYNPSPALGPARNAGVSIFQLISCLKALPPTRVAAILLRRFELPSTYLNMRSSEAYLLLDKTLQEGREGAC